MNLTKSIAKSKDLLARGAAITVLAIATVLALAPLAGAVEVKYAPEGGVYDFSVNEEGQTIIKVSVREAEDENASALEVMLGEGPAGFALNADIDNVYVDDASEYVKDAAFNRTCDVLTWTFSFVSGVNILQNETEVRLFVQGTGESSAVVGSAEYLFTTAPGEGVVYGMDETGGTPVIPEGHLLEPNCEVPADDEKAPGVPNTSRSTSSGSATLIAIGASLAGLVAGVVTCRRYSRQ